MKIDSAAYYFSRAIKWEKALTQTEILYYLIHISIDKLNSESVDIVESVKQQNWSYLIDLYSYNAQADNIWVVGAKLKNGKKFICLLQDVVELLECEQIRYYEELSEKDFMQIPFTEYKIL